MRQVLARNPILAFAGRVVRTSAFVLTVLGSSASVQAVPLDVFGHLPRLEDVSIAPDGSKVAFVRTDGEDRVVAVVSLADNKALKVVRAGHVKLRGVVWADDNRLLIETSETTMPYGLIGEDQEWWQLQVHDLRKKDPVQVPNLNRNHDEVNLMNVVSGEVMVRTIEGHTVLFVRSTYVSDATYPCLVRYDLDTDRQQIMLQGGENSSSWLVDEKGKLLAEEDYEPSSGIWRMRISRDGHLKDVASGKEGIDVPRILGYGPDDESLLTEFLENGDPVWKLLSLRDGTFEPVKDEWRSLRAPIEDPYTHHMMGGVHLHDEASYLFFDETKRKRWDAIVRAYGATDHAHFVSASADFRKIVVLVQGPRMGYQYQLVDLDLGRTRSIGDVYEGVTSPMEVRRITYEAADGLKIPGYLTLPAGRKPERLPLIVLPHGGPASVDTMDFDWWAQALADQGYAVLQPNFRGSTVDYRFLTKGYGEFGRKMQTDLSDGVRYLAREGIADPARVCIVGGSYGGYAALAGVTLDPGVYRCAASIAGISDLRAFLRWIDDKHWSSQNAEQRYWDRFLGVQGRKDPKLDEISPIKHVDAIKVPVLLVHGKDDTVVPFDQSDDMYDVLRRAHKQVEFVKLKDEDHWLSRGATRLQMLQAVVAFLRKNNPPDEQPATRIETSQ